MKTTFLFLRLQFRWAYYFDIDSDSDFCFTVVHKRSYNSDYNYDSVASVKISLWSFNTMVNNL